MASDEIVWQIINQQFCAFKLKCVPPSLFPPSPPLNPNQTLTLSQDDQREELLPQ